MIEINRLPLGLPVCLRTIWGYREISAHDGSQGKVVSLQTSTADYKWQIYRQRLQEITHNGLNFLLLFTN